MEINYNAFSDWFDGPRQPLGVVRHSINESDIDYVDMLTAVAPSSSKDSDLFQPMMSNYGKMIDLTDCRDRSHSWPGRPDQAATFNGYGGGREGSEADQMGMLQFSAFSSSTDGEQKNAEVESECSREAGGHLTVVAGIDACTWSIADGNRNGGGAEVVRDLAGSSEPTSSSVVPRRNAWGSQSYAELITQAIESSPGKRMTLSQIYDWMVRSVPYFSNKGDSYNSAGWKVRIGRDSVVVS